MGEELVAEGEIESSEDVASNSVILECWAAILDDVYGSDRFASGARRRGVGDDCAHTPTSIESVMRRHVSALFAMGVARAEAEDKQREMLAGFGEDISRHPAITGCLESILNDTYGASGRGRTAAPNTVLSAAQRQRCPIKIKDDGVFLFTNISDRTVAIRKITLNRQYSVTFPLMNYYDSGKLQSSGVLAVGEILYFSPIRLADDEGRMVYSPTRAKLQILPADDVNISELFEELRGKMVVAVYSVDGVEYLQIKHFSDHQKVDKRSPSKYPPPSNSPEIPRLSGENP
ncbi:MAG: hypothetical protein IID41_10895 [Planctomycetes bacterium]|nr:hypothetical protein [Planctomycetota bacterium]